MVPFIHIDTPGTLVSAFSSICTTRSPAGEHTGTTSALIRSLPNGCTRNIACTFHLLATFHSFTDTYPCPCAHHSPLSMHLRKKHPQLRLYPLWLRGMSMSFGSFASGFSHATFKSTFTHYAFLLRFYAFQVDKQPQLRGSCSIAVPLMV